jgi:hypothetical protein
MKHSYPTSEPLKFLLAMIHNREMALPDFQRDFVWDPYATDELIESIISNFPAGSLLRIKNGHQLLFRPRAIEGAPELTKDQKPSYLVLDGQQRLTSLYQALYGAGEHTYFLNLGALDAGNDLEDCCFYLRADVGKARLGTIEQQARELVFPLGQLFGADGYKDWATKVLAARCKDMSEMLELQTRFNRLHEKWIQPIEDYEFPMVTLNEGTSGEAVCTIFRDAESNRRETECFRPPDRPFLGAGPGSRGNSIACVFRRRVSWSLRASQAPEDAHLSMLVKGGIQPKSSRSAHT